MGQEGIHIREEDPHGQGVHHQLAGGTREGYDRVMEDMGLHGRMPPGGSFHYAGPGPDDWRVIDVWADPAAYERFAAE